MSLTAIHTRKAKKYPPHVEAEFARYEAGLAYAERFEAELLTKVFKAFHVEGTPVDLQRAAQLVGSDACLFFLSFHEALYSLAWQIDNPGLSFDFRYPRSYPPHVLRGEYRASLKFENPSVKVKPE